MDEITLRNISQYTSRGISPKYVEIDGILVLNQKCIRNQKINFAPSRFTDKSKKFGIEKRLRKFDILINSTGVGTLGRVAQLKQDVDLTVDSHITIFRTSQFVKGKNIKIDPEYVGFCIRNQEKFIESLGTGATGQTELSKDSILDKVSIYLPAYTAQNRIASILSSYDDLIENNEKRIKYLEEMAQLLYSEWFVKFKFPGYEKVKMVDSGTEYGKIPEGWKIKKTRDSFKFMGGGTPSRKEGLYWLNGDIDWYTPTDLSDNLMFIDSSSEKVSSVGLKNSSKRIFPAYSIMLTSRATIGRISINTKPSTTNQGFIVCLPNDEVPLFFLYFWLKSKVGLFIEHGTGATFKEITKDNFGEIKIIVPPQDLLNRFNGKNVSMGNEILNLQRQVENLTKTRDLLIPQLITGKRELKNYD